MNINACKKQQSHVILPYQNRYSYQPNNKFKFSNQRHQVIEFPLTSTLLLDISHISLYYIASWQPKQSNLAIKCTFYITPSIKLNKMSWQCQNCKKQVNKGYSCTCKNTENNWACTTCHFCNPTGNTMKRCGGGSNPAYWWYNPKGYSCKCGNTQNCWRCYNCDFNNAKGYSCKCGNTQNNWRCFNCDLDVSKGYSCKKCANTENCWKCPNEGFHTSKGYACKKCGITENNWRCPNCNQSQTKGYACKKCGLKG